MVKGQALIAKGDHASALIEFEVANPRETSPELETWRGQALEYNSRPDEAVNAYRRALEADPLYDEAAALYGRQLAYGGSAKLALETLEPVVKRTSKFPYAFTAIGFARRDLGDTDGALAAFNKAIKLNPSDYEPAYWAGRLYGDKNEHDKAIKNLKRARQSLRPSDGYFFDLLKRLGRSYEAVGNTAAARSTYSEYIAQAPEGDSGLPAIRRRLDRL